jgi:hypothetical protein
MQFKHPEILFALFLLIIPIIIHLFNFQRFKKEVFTNVQFLKNIQNKTRKSEQLKRWLLLLTRSLIFASLIIAFAQPFFPNKTRNKKLETNIYVDNSFSMQAASEGGALLKNNIQKIIKATAFSKGEFNVFANTKNYPKLDANSLKSTLLNLDYSPKKQFLNTVLLQINALKNTESKTLYKNILISDFQNINFNNKPVFTNVNSTNILVKTVPKINQNYFIDSVFIKNKTLDEILLNVVIKSSKKSSEKIAVSLFNDAILSGKATCKFNDSSSENVQFSIPNTNHFLGKLAINSDEIYFDNTFYFTINKPEKINVLSIGNNASFLSKIYTNSEFNYHNYSVQNLDFNQLQNQQIIILNELEEISSDLISILNEYVAKGGILIIIPSANVDINSYNFLFKQLNLGKIQEKTDKENLITTINFQHPLFKKVFERKIKNFEYPKTKITYKTNLNKAIPALSLSDNQPFLTSNTYKKGIIYWFTSPLQNKITNFTKSPLIVPAFYNMAIQQFNASKIFHTIRTNNRIDINYKLPKEEVLTIKNEKNLFIPLQTSAQNKVSLNFQNQIQKSGFYKVFAKNKLLTTLAFNYNRKESNLIYRNLETIASNQKNVTLSNSIPQVFEKIATEQKINYLFKWFLALAVLFLLIEIGLLKYFKL